MKFSKNIKKAVSFMLAFGLSYGAVTPAITPAQAAEMSYSVMISPQYEDANQFSDGLAAVKQNGKWGYVDETGKTIIPFEYDYCYPFSEGLAIVAKYRTVNDISGYYWYVIDVNNNLTPLNNPYDDSEQYYSVEIANTDYDIMFHNGYVNLRELNIYNGMADMVFDRNCNYIPMDTDSVNNDIFINGKFNEGLWAATGHEYAGFFVGADGKVVSEFGGYETNPVIDVRPVNQGLALYAVEDKNDVTKSYWGFVDTNGNTVIEPQYVDVYISNIITSYEVFNSGIAAVQNKSGLWGGINKSGQTVIPFEYEALRAFREGLAVAQKNGKFGVIDTNGNNVIPFEYDNLSGFNNGICVAVQNGKAFCIDRYGNKITGSDAINQDTYFPNGLEVTAIIFTPGDIIVTKENNLYGFSKMEFTPDLPQQSEMDSWAYDEVVKSIEADLVPTYLQNQYKINIDRGDFAALVVTLLEQASGKDIDTLVKEETGKTINELVTAYPFTDTTDTNVIAANALGIISGKGNGIFDPYASIKRQEAAALLMRIGKYMGKTDIEDIGTNFTDSSSIQSYAVEAVNYVNALNVMKGTSDTIFSPNGTYTRQQAYITALRLYNAIK